MIAENTQRINEIEKRIRAALQPTYLEIIDDSAKHRGHAGAASGAGHFSVIISAAQFEGLSLIACHRKVYEAVGDFIPKEIHALQIQVKR